MILGELSFSIQPAHLPATETSLLLCFRPGKVLLREGESAPALPTLSDLRPLLPEGFVPFELAHTDQCSVFMPDPLAGVEIPEGNGFSYQSVGAFRAMPFAQGGILTSAWHLWNWYRRSRFCGACGAPTAHCPEERALRCPGCGELYFPMIAPAVIVAITCGDSILMVLNKNRSWHHYALVAGYVEVGETLEHALAREVREEVGLAIHSVRYLGDQPWGFSGSLMFAFHAQADKNAPLTLQQSELSDAKWVDRNELSAEEHPVSIAAELLERFRTGTL